MDPAFKFRIRDACSKDGAEILEIYSPYILSSSTSLEFELPSVEEMIERIETTLEDLPWLVCETENGSVAGYAYACKHRVRAGYQWAVELASYVSPNYRRQGIARILYDKLFSILKQQGYFKALAIISGENEPSVNFHKQMGFTFAGSWKNVGNKFGKWVDVNSYSKDLQELKEQPPAPLPYSVMKTQTSK